MEVSVRAPAHSELYLTGGGEAYKRTLGGIKKFTGAELLNALLGQLIEKLRQSGMLLDEKNPDLP